MRQKDFLFPTVDQAIDGLDAVRDFIDAAPHADVLLSLYAAGVTERDMTRLLDVLDASMPDAKRAGITEFPYGLVSDSATDGNVRVNAMVSDAARFQVAQVACEPAAERAAAFQMLDFLGAADDDKYLGVHWGDSFVSNVCEFPLMVQRNGVDICMAPIAAGEKGELYLSGRTGSQEKVRFSYGTRESAHYRRRRCLRRHDEQPQLPRRHAPGESARAGGAGPRNSVRPPLRRYKS